jgi:hypothetical protein
MSPLAYAGGKPGNHNGQVPQAGASRSATSRQPRVLVGRHKGVEALQGRTGGRPRQYGRTGLTYCTVVGCSEREQSHMQKEAGHGEGYYLRGAR